MYNSHELARARAVLTSEMNKDVFRVLQSRLDGYAKSANQFPDNLWEGPNGEMEHIKSSFPMPLKVHEQDSDVASTSPSQNTLNTSSKDDVTITSHSKSPSTPSELHISQNSEVIHVSDEDASTSEVEILPSKALTDSGVIIDISDNVSSDADIDFSSEEEEGENKTNSKISECEKSNSSKSNSSVTKQPNTNTSIDKTVNSDSISIISIVNASVNEKKHWNRLSDLQKKIINALNELSDLKLRLKKNKSERECKEMDTVHWNIHGFITSLTEEKKCRDMNKFRNFGKKHLSKLKNSKSVSILPHSYSSTWHTLKNLCRSFEAALKSNKSVLAEFGVLQDVPKSKLTVRMAKIRLKN